MKKKKSQFVKRKLAKRRVQRRLRRSIDKVEDLLGIEESPLMRALGSVQGRSKLAASMVAPLRQQMNYQSIGRKAFSVQPLTGGAVPNYGAGTSKKK